jgi:RNA recognition motif-containing protein
MRIFVGNLPWKITKEKLVEEFSKIGAVDAENCLIVMTPDGRSKGFGFIEMSNEDEAKKAVEELNGKELDDGTGTGRAMVVNEARPMKNKE